LQDVWKKEFKGKVRTTRSRLYFRLDKSPEAILEHDEDSGSAFLTLRNKRRPVWLFDEDGYGILKKIHRSLKRK
jgi:hypothetical protein